MVHAEDSLIQAAADARFLLSRDYPRERVLRVVGDRWNLDSDGRHLLRRGVFAPKEAGARKIRLLALEDCRGKNIGIDGHNVLITLETALGGGQLIQGDDGVVRDIAGRGSNYRPGAGTQEAADLMIKALLRAKAGSVQMYFDAPISKSGELAALLRDMIRQAGLAGDAHAVAVPEQQLQKHFGPVASSDSILIDQVAEPIDLAGLIIRESKPAPAMETLKSDDVLTYNSD
jgi:hypothetical protein